MSAIWALGPHSQLIGSVGQESGRILVGPYFLAVYGLFGLNSHLVIAWTSAMGILMAFAALIALRQYGFTLRDSLGVALLVLAFAPADAPRLWPAAGHANVAGALFLCGAAIAVPGFRARSSAVRAAFHLSSLALYVLSVITYETAAGAIAVSVLGYRSVTSLRNARMRWYADLAIVALTVAIAVAFTSHPSEPLGGALVTHVAKLVAGAVLVATWAVFPVGATHSPNAFRIVGAAILLAAAAVGMSRARHDEVSKRWLIVLGGGLGFAMAAYATYIPAAGYTPVGRGIANRTNILSEVGMGAAAYGAVHLLGNAAAERWRPSIRSLFVAPLLGLLALGYVVRTVRDERSWDAAANAQEAVLKRLIAVAPRPSPGTTMLVFGVPGFLTPGVPIFYAPWDLTGAVQLYWHDRRLAAWPVTAGVGVICGRDVIRLTGPNFAGAHAGYRKLVFVDLRTNESLKIRTPTACSRWRYPKLGVTVTS
jgi:hypothetical protein